MDIYSKLAKAKLERKSVALAVITQTVGSTPRKAGSKMLVYPDGNIFGTIGGGVIEEKVIKTAMQSLHDRQIRYLRFALNNNKKLNKSKGEDIGMICGGDMEVYIEPVLPDSRLYLIGAGHISLALAPIAKLVGFEVVVIDSEKKYANRTRFPKAVAEKVMVSDFKKAIEKVNFDESAYIAILTRSHVKDRESLAACLKKPQPFAYLGMIGSKQKITATFTALMKSGIPKKKLDMVYAPIGLDIGAETPEEIAISILAELIAVKYHKSVNRG